MDKLEKIAAMNSKLIEFSKIANQLNYIPENVKQMIEIQKKFKSMLPTFDIPKIDFPKFKIPTIQPLVDSQLYEALKGISKIGEKIKNNPELQFAFISDLEILNLKSAEELKESLISDLTDEDIKAKDELLDENLLPYLKDLGLETLWLGAGYVLESEHNPDRLRHCLISLRTILEFLIDEELAPLNKLKDCEMFEKEFRRYHLGKQNLEFVKIPRDRKIEFFTSKFKFGMLDEFTKNEIQYICNCYSILCNVHQPNIGITENQVRSLKVKTGITIWLMVYLNKIIKEDND